MLDHWTQNKLPQLNELPNLGFCLLKKYETNAKKLRCFALTYHGKSLWDTFKMNRRFAGQQKRGYCSVKCAAQIGIELTKSI